MYIMQMMHLKSLGHSKEIKEQNFSNPNQFLEYKRKKEKEAELLKSVPPSLRPYYKTRVNEYFKTLQD